MTQSSLCTYRHITRNHSSGRGGSRVCKITPHYMAARWSGRQCADYFASTSRQASSNYCIGVGGDIAMSVDEDDRAWTSSSGWNDRQAITIECGNVDNKTGEMTQQTWDSLVSLCADVCRRYGFRLSYTGDRSGSLTEHRMFSSTDCPGAWLHARMGQLASEVNARLDGGTAAKSTPMASTPATSGLTVDGWWGSATTRRLQQVLGTPADGVVSSQWSGRKGILKACTSGWEWTGSPKGSTVIRAMQGRLGVSADGIMGPATVKALEARYGTVQDGRLDGPSRTVKLMQEALNSGRF